MKHWTGDVIRARIQEVIPKGYVIPRHDKNGHFYEIDLASHDMWRLRFYEDGYTLPKKEFEGGMMSGVLPCNPVYPSVTGKLQVLKDDGLINYKMNRALEYVFGHFKDFRDDNIMEHLDLAARVSVDILSDAGDIGTRCHNYREAIFNKWIETGERPKDFLSFIPAEDVDVRAISAIRALDKFCTEMDYIPVVCELLVYSHKLKAAGTLDDLGLIRKVIRKSKDENCQYSHDMNLGVNGMIVNPKNGKHTCMGCDYQYRYEFCLMDFKTSNQFKDHYFYQVALYYEMFVKLMGLAWKPERCFILKVSKEDGTYKIEDLKKPSKLAEYARSIIKTNEGVEFIKSLRKDNQRVVAPLMQL
jgi:hypothetical protein